MLIDVLVLLAHEEFRILSGADQRYSGMPSALQVWRCYASSLALKIVSGYFRLPDKAA